MKTKLPTNRQQLNFLKKLMTTKISHKNGFIIDDSFCSNFKLSKIEITQILNALNSKGLIDMFPPNQTTPFPYITVSQKAFAYIPDLQDNLFRFWLPIIVSSCLSVAAIVISLVAIWQ